MRAISWSLTLLLVLVAWAGSARGQVKLEWKFHEGVTLYFEAETVQKQELTFMGKPFKQTEKVSQLISLSVKEAKPGATILVQRIEKVKIQSEGSAVTSGDAKLAEKMAGTAFMLTLDAAGRITTFEGYDAFIKKVSDGNAEAEKLARAMLPEEVLRHAADEFFQFLPLTAVKKDTVWKRDETLPLGPLGSFKTATQFTYEGIDKDGEVISAKTALTYVPPTAGAGVFKITKGNLNADDARGRYVFDADKGRLVHAQRSMMLKGNLTIDFMGKQADMAVMMDMTHTLRAVDKKSTETP
jgi:hypothetical protein